MSVCKEHNAIPLHGESSLYLWSLRRDGVVLQTDLDTALNTTVPSSQPLLGFVMILRGTRDYPELAELLHPPRGARQAPTAALSKA